MPVLLLLLALAVPTPALAQATRPPAQHATWVIAAAARPAVDGTASVSSAAAPLEITVTGDGAFPARAGNPVLHVGSVALRKYHYAGTESRTLVFTVPPDVTLEEGAPVYLQYEPGGSLRIDMGPFHGKAAR